jgi:hypothetical protein
MSIAWLLPMAIWLVNICLLRFNTLTCFNAGFAFINSLFWLYLHNWLGNRYYLRVTENYLVINSSLLKTNKKYFFRNLKSLEKKAHTLVLSFKNNKKVKIFLKALTVKDQDFIQNELMAAAGKYIST